MKSPEDAHDPKTTDEQWRAKLSAEEFEVTRRGGTEPAFTGRYWDTKTQGLYHCVCCGQTLFDSETKFDSGSGWPSFYQAVEPDHIETLDDRSHGMRKIEVRCSKCDAHLGHMFPDGPEPTGMRYCINSLALKLREGDSTDD